jgi:secreted PhoX family phosphatase
LSRRQFLLSAGLTGGGLLAFYGLAKRYGLIEIPASLSSTEAAYGPLIAAKTKNTGETLLALPKDFQYTVFGKTGTRMFDNHPTPPAHDGMAAFRVGDQLRLVRNHEVAIKTGAPGAAIGPNAYDQLAGGGTTTLVIDPKTRELVTDFITLSGTLNNRAGGATPWNSWISCEETVLGPAKVKNADGAYEVDLKRVMVTVSRFLPQLTKLSRPCRSKRWVASCTKLWRLITRPGSFISPRICRRADSTGLFLTSRANS